MPLSIPLPSLASRKNVNHQASKTFGGQCHARANLLPALKHHRTGNLPFSKADVASFNLTRAQNGPFLSFNLCSNSICVSSVMQAYQVLKNGGLEDDHIVVMMSDDLANNIMNPHPGKLFNRPYGPDVYEGVPLVCSARLNDLLSLSSGAFCCQPAEGCMPGTTNRHLA